MIAPSHSGSRTAGRRRRAALFRFAAVLLGLSPLLLFELVLRLFGWGVPAETADPFVGFSAVYPLFVRDASGTRFEVSRSRQGYFRADSFAVEKGTGEYRIFCLGGSTVQGRPYAVETSFTTWLELGLRAAEEDRAWEVVNCGGVSYASYRLVPILKEVLGHAPDLVIVYTGHNEFLEDRSYGHLRRLPRFLAAPRDLVAGLRTFTLLRSAYLAMTGPIDATAAATRPILAAEVDAVLDHRGGLDLYRRDAAWRRDVVEHFRFNLASMARMAAAQGVPMLLVNPVSNLGDCPPFKSAHREGLTPAALERWTSLRKEAAARYRTDRHAAVGRLEEALGIDAEHAGLHYQIAKYYESLGRLDRARQAYERARELDVCPLRMVEAMHRAVLDTARRWRLALVDIRALFEARSRGGIPDGEWLLDHVHPSIPGHQLIAAALIEEMRRQGLVRPSPGWSERRERSFEAHSRGLDHIYFARGQRRLENLRAWAAGRAGAELFETDLPE